MHIKCLAKCLAHNKCSDNNGSCYSTILFSFWFLRDEEIEIREVKVTERPGLESRLCLLTRCVNLDKSLNLSGFSDHFLARTVLHI